MNVLGGTVAALLALATATGETTVHAPRPAELDDDRVPAGDALLLPAPEELVAEALGASLVHDGGPLAPTRAVVRGLAGARLGVDVGGAHGGLSLTDPATGLFDLGLVPWALVDSLVVDSGAGPRGLGGNLSLTLDEDAGVRARVLAGSAGTTRSSLAASSTTHDTSVLAAVDAGITRGDFAFVPTSAAGAKPGDVLVRENNDQRRVGALALARQRIDGVDISALGLVAAHDGGIPGLATSPTRSLRGEDALAGGRLFVDAGGGWVALDGRANHRATFGPDDPRESIESWSAGASSGFTASALGARLDVRSGADLAAVEGTGFSRLAGHASSSLALPLADTARARIAADVRLTSDVGTLVGGEARVEMGEVLRASLGVSRSSRAPTLDELYAPRGVVLGNPALRPETLHDVELAVGFVPGRVVEARAVAFAGVLDQTITWVNRNAYEVAPVNLGSAWRAGVDVKLGVEPVDFLGLDVVAEALATQVDETRAPLPLAPPFSSRLSLRFGRAQDAHIAAVIRSRGDASSNIFGTLTAPGYTLVDVIARLPLSSSLALGVSITNALDVLDARDTNQLPLPGRMAFLSLEVNG
jgi:hypothetical protein